MSDDIEKRHESNIISALLESNHDPLLTSLVNDMNEVKARLVVLEQRKRLSEEERAARAALLTPHNYQGTCTRCGMIFSGPTGYACPQINCPCGLGHFKVVDD